MSDKSKIEWTEATWNITTGCTRVSPGCDFCYAVRVTKRLAPTSKRYRGLIEPGKHHFNGVIKTHEDLLEQPLRWKRPRRIFVCSTSDLFHEQVPSEFILRAIETMREADWHQFQVLTKRPERMRELGYSLNHEWPGNVWLGTSVEAQEQVERIVQLRSCITPRRWISFEPLIGPVELPKHYLAGIAWAVVGGESGADARLCKPEWVESILHACRRSGTAFYMKQTGSKWAQTRLASTWKGGQLRDIPEHLRIREYPEGM